MKKYLLTLSVFLIFLKVIDLVVYEFLLHSEKHYTNKSNTLGDLFSGQINTDVIFIGSSRIQCHINPEIIQKGTGLSAFNLATGGANFEEQVFTLKTYLENNSKPRLVVFEADEYSLDTSYLEFNKNSFKPYRGYSKLVAEMVAEEQDWRTQLQNYSFKSVFFTGRVYNILQGAISHILFNSKYDKKNIMLTVSTDPRILSFKGSYLIDVQLDSLKVEKVAVQISPDRQNGFKVLKEFVEKEELELILIHTPRLDGQIELNKYNQVSAFYDTLAKSSPFITHWDLSKDIEFQDKKLWSDSYHLNLIGANMLSEKIRKKIKQ